MINIAIFGVPGAGKGTQSELLSQQLKLKHISTGNIVRREIEQRTPFGKKAYEMSTQGELVNDELIAEMFKNEFKKLINPHGFLFDGFPRTINQAQIMDSFLLSFGIKLNMFIELIISEEESLKRLLKRATEEGRIDDSPEVIKKRFKLYKSNTAPITDYYKKKQLYTGIDGLRSIEEINLDLMNKIECFL